MGKRVTAIEVVFKVIRDVPSKKRCFDVCTPTVRFDRNDIRGNIRKNDHFWLEKAFLAWRKHRNIPDDEVLMPKDIEVRRLHIGR